MEDELDTLREKSTRASTMYDDLEGEDSDESGGNLLSSFSPQQRLILAILLFLDAVALACVVLIWTGNIPLF